MERDLERRDRILSNSYRTTRIHTNDHECKILGSARGSRAGDGGLAVANVSYFTPHRCAGFETRSRRKVNSGSGKSV